MLREHFWNTISQQFVTAQLLGFLLALSAEHEKILEITQKTHLYITRAQIDKALSEDTRLRSISSNTEYFKLVCHTVSFLKSVQSENFFDGSGRSKLPASAILFLLLTAFPTRISEI